MHENYRLSNIYSCILAEPIAHRVRVDFILLSFMLRATFSRVSKMFDMKEKVARSYVYLQMWFGVLWIQMSSTDFRANFIGFSRTQQDLSRRLAQDL